MCLQKFILFAVQNTDAPNFFFALTPDQSPKSPGYSPGCRYFLPGKDIDKVVTLTETLWTEAGSGMLISILEKFNWFHLTGLITLVLLM